jgi:hypothetical protein
LETKLLSPLKFNMLLRKLHYVISTLRCKGILTVHRITLSYFSLRSLLEEATPSLWVYPPFQCLKQLTDIHAMWHTRHVTVCHHDFKRCYFLQSAVSWRISKALRWRRHKYHLIYAQKDTYAALFTVNFCSKSTNMQDDWACSSEAGNKNIHNWWEKPLGNFLLGDWGGVVRITRRPSLGE